MTEKRCEQERAVSVKNRGSCCGQQLNIMAAAFANYLGEGLSVDQLGLLSAFLQSVGESLDVIASARQLCAGNDNNIADNSYRSVKWDFSEKIKVRP